MTLSGDLDALVAADLIRQVPDLTDLEYEFRHALIQEAAYYEILKEDRPALHLAVGEALERLHADHPGEVAPELAFHFRRAGEAEKAVAYLVQSADLAAGRYANAEALAALDEALELVQDDDPRTPAMQERIADICLIIGRHQDALDAFGRASRRAESTLDRSRLERKAGSCFPMGPDFEGPLGHLDRAAELLGSTPFGEPAAWWHEWIQVRLKRGFVLYFASGSPKMASELARLVEEIKGPLDRWGTSQQRAEYSIDCAGPYQSRVDGMGPSDAMLQIALDGVVAADACGDMRLIGRSRFILGLSRLNRSELDEAVGTLTEVARISDGIGDAEWSCRSLTYLAIAARRLGDVEGVRGALERAEPLVTNPGFALYRGAFIANRGWLAWRSGETDEAARSFDEAEQVWVEQNIPYPFTWIAAMPAIAIALECDDVEAAVRHAVTLIGLPFGRALPDAVLELLGTAVEDWGAGRKDEARRALELSVDRAGETGHL